ncbi:SIS domain-containing protein [Planctobacterium marinum]|uniref:Phosphoheptose isomerase n=1 Tax=Planctobacterium marinum TaxID=1631968 RepID=A0AA48HQF8_9ALTE|nr:phosphoheptose isomerase [Planctobacterium marinum]
MKNLIANYLEKLQKATQEMEWSPVEVLAKALYQAVQKGRRVYLCGNGGSAGNAVHLANDFLYGIAPDGEAMKVEALPANSSVLTCLGNDIGYENIFSHQLKVKAETGDLLIVLSGSGNSPNILNALAMAKQKSMQSFAILGYSGGQAKTLADVAIHFPVDDMQIAEDTQLIVGHMLMQYLNQELARA